MGKLYRFFNFIRKHNILLPVVSMFKVFLLFLTKLSRKKCQIMKQSFGEYIRQLREEKKMPLRKLAARLDIDQSTLSKIERNERKAISSMVPILAETFKLDYKKLKVRFLSDNIVNYLSQEDFPLEVLKVAEQKIEYLIKHKV